MPTATDTQIEPYSTSIEEYAKTAAHLLELSSLYKGIQYDVNTKDGLVAATKARSELRTLRIALEKTRVMIKAPALKRTQEIDTEARRLTAAISELEDPIDVQIKAEETRKETARLAAAKAEQDRIEAEQRAIKEAEQRKIEEAQAEIRRRQEELDKAEQDSKDREAAAQKKIDDDARAARLKIEEEERQARAQRDEADRVARLAREEEERKARAIRDEQDRLARVARDEEERIAREAREAEEFKLKQERDRIDAERRAVEEKQRLAREEEELKAKHERDRIEAEQRAAEEIARKEREAEEEKQREVKRRANDVLDASALLTSFVQRFGHLDEFAPAVSFITAFLKRA